MAATPAIEHVVGCVHAAFDQVVIFGIDLCRIEIQSVAISLTPGHISAINLDVFLFGPRDYARIGFYTLRDVKKAILPVLKPVSLIRRGPRRIAGGLGTYPISFMIALILHAVSELTLPSLLMTRDTVVWDTPANFAISTIDISASC